MRTTAPGASLDEGIGRYLEAGHEQRVLRQEDEGIYVMIDMEKLKGPAREKALDGMKSIIRRLES